MRTVILIIVYSFFVCVLGGTTFAKTKSSTPDYEVRRLNSIAELPNKLKLRREERGQTVLKAQFVRGCVQGEIIEPYYSSLNNLNRYLPEYEKKRLQEIASLYIKFGVNNNKKLERIKKDGLQSVYDVIVNRCAAESFAEKFSHLQTIIVNHNNI